MSQQIPMAETSLCDTCTDPGRCCRKFVLNIGYQPADRWRETSAEYVRAHNQIAQECERVPFEPLEVGHVLEDGRVGVFFTCPKVGDDGRCTIYDSRPSVCRRYEPGSDGICAMHTPEATTTTESAE